jgi:aspartyl aminopeptidase
MARRLDAGGFTRLSERETWALAPGDARYVAREGSLAAFRVGSAPPDAAGFRLVGAHTDSPTFKVRPRPGATKAGYRMVGVEVYGGPLAHTWMDRDLTAAGRVVLHDGSEHLVVLPGAPLKLASLAIHLTDRTANPEGARLNAQEHLQPLWSPGTSAAFLEVVAAAAGVAPEAVLGHDLVLADTQPAGLVGHDGALVSAPRLDNLSSCHAAVSAILAAEPARATQLVVANDHEEVGSGSAEGAKGSFLQDVLERVVAATGGDGQARAAASARSVLVSCDAAHAVHPNYADRHEPEHRPRFGGGPVVKSNANQSYATDGRTLAWFAARCADAGVPVQHFVSRADLPCGSTIGPLTATRLGIATVDVGNPVLGMHSARETGGAADVEPMVAALTAHLEVHAAW